ncbi:hypothetical protein [Caulobacter sp. NIBR1757]|uniref:hypothetical protein n=1 Tax=Caulobacter sp. NIBR1757 TaxID=3016000 RepID=UPI0022F010AF|nr:hypothetical protein [Caulobacter sp. NIBR1757]WGM40828.1 hypothetical protein AMEJIAPC_03775 [Caulobacter sp. NIBR1757]
MKGIPIDPAQRTPVQERYLLKLGMDHFLRQLSVLSAPFDGDVLLAATFVAVWQASVKHLNEPGMPSPLAVEGVFPDGMRRAVTIASVARTLGLPRETARRYVHRLIASGHCRTVGARGVTVPSEVLRSEAMNQLAREHVEVMRSLFDGYERSQDLLKA